MSDGSTVVRLDIFARGAPAGSSLQEALHFFLRAREEIVRLFADVTTENAHLQWGRVI